MRIFKGYAEYQTFMVRRFSAHVHNMERAHDVLAREMKRIFVDVLSGKIKQKVLNKMGNPFARNGPAMRGIDPSFWTAKRTVRAYRTSSKVAYRRYTDSYGKKRIKSQITAKGAINLRPINVQKGKLRRLVVLESPHFLDGSRTYKLYSLAAHNKHVLAVMGTLLMVARGVLGPKGYLRQKHKELIVALRTAHKKSLRS